MEHVEQQIIQNLLTNEQYLRKVLPFLKVEYFTDSFSKTVFRIVHDYVELYSDVPAKAAVVVALERDKKITDEELQDYKDLIESITKEEVNLEWLIDTTEAWIKDRAVFLGIMESIEIIDGKHKQKDKSAIPSILQDALAVSFDNSVGHDYLEDIESRYEYYHSNAKRVPCNIDIINRVTGGGFPVKTINIFMAGTNVGKTIMLCNMAAAFIQLGYDGLYITMEMSEEEISKRVDANLLDIEMDMLSDMPLIAFKSRIEKLKAKTLGRLVVKEYPTAAAHTGHFRHLIEEIKIKKGFTPKFLIVDYLNICGSSRMKAGVGATNPYAYVKSITEELRGLAVEYEVPLLTATQFNREGFQSSNPGMENASESFGVPMTADWICGMTTNDQLAAVGRMHCTQLKTRYDDINRNRTFDLGLDKKKMRFYDLGAAGSNTDVPDIAGDPGADDTYESPDDPVRTCDDDDDDFSFKPRRKRFNF